MEGLCLRMSNSVKYAKKAAQAGVDGLVLVSAGAGGHTGSITGFAFVDAVRDFGMVSLCWPEEFLREKDTLAAQTLGADLVLGDQVYSSQ